MNVDLLRRVADVIESEPERYRQTSYASHMGECGSAYCIAGWAVALTAADGDLHPSRYRTGCDCSYCARTGLADEEVIARVLAGDDIPGFSWSAAGQDLLGIVGGEVAFLFDGALVAPEGLTMPDYLRAIADRPDRLDRHARATRRIFNWAPADTWVADAEVITRAWRIVLAEEQSVARETEAAVSP